MPGRSFLATLALALLTCSQNSVSGWSFPSQHALSRRDVFRRANSGMMAGILAVGGLSQSATAAVDTEKLKGELVDSRSKLTAIPDLLQNQEWDKVRNILKMPPVNKLWNLGESQNTVMQLAKELGDPELFELKDTLAYNLQICDQLTYDNVFIYFQPGSGKINIKDPTDAANISMKVLDQIIDATK